MGQSSGIAAPAGTASGGREPQRHRDTEKNEGAEKAQAALKADQTAEAGDKADPRNQAADQPLAELLSDGSSGQETEYRGVGGIVLPAYIRKPAGAGPFPVIVMMHGGAAHRGLRCRWAVRCSRPSPTS